MKALEEGETEIRIFPPDKQKELRDWLEKILADRLEFADEFKAMSEREEKNLREGRKP